MSSKEKQSRRRYTAEFKEQAVKRVLAGHAVTVVARELGVGDSLIHNWLARHRQQAGAGAVQAEQAAEIIRLKRLLAQREEEVTILKNFSRGALWAPPFVGPETWLRHTMGASP